MADDLRFSISADNAQALQAITQLATAMQSLVGQVQSSASASNNAAAGMHTLAGGMQQSVTVGAALGAAIGTLAGQQLDRLVSGIVSWGKEALNAAARTETLTGVAQFLGSGIGKSKDEINALITALNKQGITMQESASLISQLIRVHIDLSNATKLAAVAQNIAALSGKNSSDVLNGLMEAIVKLSPQMLDQYGIIIKNSEAFKMYGDKIGKLPGDLTPAERSLALLNAVFEQGDRIAGVYGVSMGFVGKQMGSLQRFIQDAQNEIGKNFLPAMRLAIGAATELFKEIRESPEVFLAAAAAIGAMGAAAAIAAGGGFLAITGGTGALILAIGALVGLIPALIGKYHELTGTYEDARHAIDAGEKALWGFATAIANGRKLTDEDVAALTSFITANKDATGQTAQLVEVLKALLRQHLESVGPVDAHTDALKRWNEEVRKWRLDGSKGTMPSLDASQLSLPDAQIRIKVAAPTGASASQELAALQAAYNEQVKRGGEYLAAYTRQMDKYGMSAKEVAAKVNEHLGAEIVTEQTVTRLSKEYDAATKVQDKLKDKETERTAILQKLSGSTVALTAAQIAQVDAAQKLGLSVSEIAKAYQLNELAVQGHVDSLKFWKDFHTQTLELAKKEEEAFTKAQNDRAEVGNKRTADALKTYYDLHQENSRAIAQLHMSDLQREVDNLHREYDEKRKTIDGTTELGRMALAELGTAEARAVEQTIKNSTRQADVARDAYERIKNDALSTKAQVEQAWDEWYEKDYTARKAWVDEWQETLGTLSQAFSQLAQVAGGSFGGIVKDIGVLINSLNVASEGTKSFEKGMAQMDDGQISKGLANIATGAVSIAAGFMQATEAGGTMSKTLKGAAMGAQVGAQFGGAYGAAIGAAIGATAGLLRGMFGGPDKVEKAGREAADTFAKGLADGMTKGQKAEVLAAVAMGASQKWATEMIGVRDAYVAAGKSIADAEDVVNRLWKAEKQGPEAVKKVIAEINGVIDEHKEKMEAQKKAADEFADTFKSLLSDIASSGKLASKELLDMVGQLEKAGQMTEEIQAFRQAGMAKAADGLNRYFQVYLDGNKQWIESDKKLDQLREELKTADGKRRDEILREIASVTQAMHEQERSIDAVRITSQATADAMGAAIAGIFAGLVQGGAAPLAALKELAPAIESLGAQLEHSGLKGSAAFLEIANMAQMAKDEVAGPMLAGVQGLGDALVGLHNSGLLTQSMFEGLTTQITQTFEKLVKQGYDGDNALRMMQPSLQRVWELQQDFGYEVDASTQLMLDQATTAGIVGDKHRSASDKMSKGISRLVELMEAFLKQMGVELPVETKKGTDAAVDGLHDVELAAEDATAAVEDLGTATEAAGIKAETAGIQAATAGSKATASFKSAGSAAREANTEFSRPVTKTVTTLHQDVWGSGPADPRWSMRKEEDGVHYRDLPTDPLTGEVIPYEKWLPTFLANNTHVGDQNAPNDTYEKSDPRYDDKQRAREAYGNVPGRATGSPGLLPEYWGKGTNVMLHDWETVVPKGREAEAFLTAAVAMRGTTLTMPGAGRGDDPMLDEMRALRRDLASMRSGPSTLEIPISVGGHELERRVINITQKALDERRLMSRADTVRRRR